MNSPPSSQSESAGSVHVEPGLEVDEKHGEVWVSREIGERYLALLQRDHDNIERELRWITEKSGYTLSGIPFGGTSLSRLSGEDRGWSPVLAGATDYDPFTNRVAIDTYLADTWHRDPVARNIIRNYVFFTFGGGFSVNFKNEKRQEEFRAWADAVCFDDFVERIIREQTLFGYCATIFYPLTEIPTVDTEQRQKALAKTDRDGSTTEQVAAREEAYRDEDALIDLMTAPRTEAETFRFVPDARIVSIVRHPEDYTRVLAYEIEGFAHLVAARDVQTYSGETIGTGCRGTSILTPVLRELVYLRKWAEARFYLNLTRSRLPVIRSGAKSATGRTAEGTEWKTLPAPGSVISDAAEWKVPALNIDSGGIADDFRHLVLRVAAGVSLPEFLVLQDASNNNYASILVAESPAHNMFRALQRHFVAKLEQLIALFGFEDGEVQAPAVVPRDLLSESKAYQVMLAEELVSRQTSAERLGLSWEDEQRRMADEESNGAIGGDRRKGAGDRNPPPFGSET